MKAYSQDLRERVIAAVEAGQQSQPEIAKTFGVSESTIDKWVKRWRDTGSVAALPFAGGRQRTLKGVTTVIRAEVKQQPDVTLDELCERVAAQTGVTRESQHDVARTPGPGVAPKKKIAPRQRPGHAARETAARRLCGARYRGIGGYPASPQVPG